MELRSNRPERCASGARSLLLAVTFTLFGLAAIAGIARLAMTATHDTVSIVGIAVLGGVVTCMFGGWIASRPHARKETIVRAPPAVVDPHRAIHASPYRGAPPPEAITPAPPRASSRATTIVVVACLTFTAAIVPVALHRSRWVEIETVLAGWWVVWAVVLSFVARRGATFADDHTFAITSPFSGVRRWFEGVSRDRKRGKTAWSFELGDLLTGLGDIDGLVLLVVLPIVLPIVFFAAWFVVELVAPVLFFVAYIGVVRALRHAAAYRGSPRRAVVGGVAWATAYVAPLAVVVWICHLCFGSRS